MTQKKKLQVFVSSTYTDLQEERQAAVQAILTAGHIPAGMELFAAGDETQMNVIKRWIDESDVYMLILGGRYGSIEPKSQKSYIHLEYEYALEKNKPLFAVVIDEGHLDEKVKRDGLKAVENDHSEKLKEFRELVCNRMVRFWKDPKDIKLAILETMADFSKREDLIGWIPGNEEINSGVVAEEIAQLVKENKVLREQIQSHQSSTITFSGLSFDEMYGVLAKTQLVPADRDKYRTKIEEVATLFGDPEPTLLHMFWVNSKLLQQGKIYQNYNFIDNLEELGLVDKKVHSGQSYIRLSVKLTEYGRQFILRLRIKKADIIEKADNYLLSEKP